MACARECGPSSRREPQPHIRRRGSRRDLGRVCGPRHGHRRAAGIRRPFLEARRGPCRQSSHHRARGRGHWAARAVAVRHERRCRDTHGRRDWASLDRRRPCARWRRHRRPALPRTHPARRAGGRALTRGSRHVPRSVAPTGDRAVSPAVGLRLGRVSRVPDAADRPRPVQRTARRRRHVPGENASGPHQAQARATERLRRLVESLLDFGRMEAGKRPYGIEPVDAGALVRDTVDEFRAGLDGRGFDVRCQVEAAVTRFSPMPRRSAERCGISSTTP